MRSHVRLTLRIRRILVASVVATLVLTVAEPGEAAYAHGGFPLPSWTGLVHWFQSPNWGPLPQQDGGSADGKAHTVPANATRANRGAGHKPGTGSGELPAYTPYQRSAKAGQSGSAKGQFDPKTSTMDSHRSSATETWYHNADGSLTRHVAQHPINYQQAPGVWAPIDPTLTRDAHGRLVEKANSLGLSFAPDAHPSTDDLAQVALSSSQAVGFSLNGAADVAGTVAGDTVTYPNIATATTLVETGGPTGGLPTVAR